MQNPASYHIEKRCNLRQLTL